MKYFFLILVVCSNLYAAGTPCFTYEVFEHPVALPPIPPNNALINYPYNQIRLSHAAILAGPGAPIQVNLGQFAIAPGVPWAFNMPFAGPPPPINLININLIIARRLAHEVPIAAPLLANLAAANAVGAVIPQLLISLRAGGYLNNMASILNRLSLVIFAPATILGVPVLAFIPDSVIVHIAIPQHVSKNLRELSHSSLATAVPGGLTLKDSINDPFILGGFPLPNSATIVSSHGLQ